MLGVIQATPPSLVSQPDERCHSARNAARQGAVPPRYRAKWEHAKSQFGRNSGALWISQLTTRFAGRPIAVCLEQSRGALLFSLSKYDNLVLYPIHPAVANSFRKAVYPSGSKS